MFELTKEVTNIYEKVTPPVGQGAGAFCTPNWGMGVDFSLPGT